MTIPEQPNPNEWGPGTNTTPPVEQPAPTQPADGNPYYGATGPTQQYPAQGYQTPYPQAPYPQAPNGQPQYQSQYPPTYMGQQGYVDPYAKSRLVAGLLGIFLGGLGVHRFYLGNTGMGIAQIAVTICTFGMGYIWGFIEGIMILAGSSSFQTDASGRPLRP